MPCRIVERGFPGSRGAGIQPRTREIFEDLGVLDAVGVCSNSCVSQGGRGRPGGNQERHPS
ncbi:hypothetical protein [Streptomyces fulvoviolaceus]|uniref:hypothetical protein n=1 Tax=Streptomyces fulvoviolaceus TaxID=285535 RepID=UPI0036F2B3D1